MHRLGRTPTLVVSTVKVTTARTRTRSEVDPRLASVWGVYREQWHTTMPLNYTREVLTWRNVGSNPVGTTCPAARHTGPPCYRNCAQRREIRVSEPQHSDQRQRSIALTPTNLKRNSNRITTPTSPSRSAGFREPSPWPGRCSCPRPERNRSNPAADDTGSSTSGIG